MQTKLKLKEIHFLITPCMDGNDLVVDHFFVHFIPELFLFSRAANTDKFNSLCSVKFCVWAHDELCTAVQ